MDSYVVIQHIFCDVVIEAEFIPSYCVLPAYSFVKFTRDENLKLILK